jgi:hypothetical protein
MTIALPVPQKIKKNQRAKDLEVPQGAATCSEQGTQQ